MFHLLIQSVLFSISTVLFIQSVIFYLKQCPVFIFASLQNGLRDKTTITYNTPLGVIFGVKKYADSLMKVVDRKGIKVNFKRRILEVRGDKKEAVFEFLDNGVQEVYKVCTRCGLCVCVLGGGRGGWSIEHPAI